MYCGHSAVYTCLSIHHKIVCTLHLVQHGIVETQGGCLNFGGN